LLGLGLANAEVSMATTKWYGFAVAALSLLSTYPLAAQTAPSSVSPRGATAIRPAHQSPCWQQAGISQSAMQQRKQIEEGTHSQVESVCSDSSLTPQQKQQKIRQLRQEAQKQVEGLITPQQEQALKSCRASRGEGPRMGGTHAGGGGPCGEMISGNKP
jgi:Spy/CpxP family protein refolding chaperone